MEEHVGKKRRKEIREAINMKKELNSTLLLMLGLMLAGCLLYGAYTILLIEGVIPAGDQVSQVVPLIIVFILVVFLGNKAYRWTDKREQFKTHCKKFDITKEDMKALKRGEL